MSYSRVDYLFYMFVLKGVKYGFPFLSEFYKSRLPQNLQLMGHCGLAYPQDLRQVAYTHLCYKQSAQYPYSGGVTENLEKVGQIKEDFLFRDLFFTLLTVSS